MYYSGKQTGVGVGAAVVFTRVAKMDYVSSYLGKSAILALRM